MEQDPADPAAPAPPAIAAVAGPPTDDEEMRGGLVTIIEVFAPAAGGAD